MKHLLGKINPVYLLIVAVVFAIYLPGLNGPFVFDDVPGIVENQAVASTNSPLDALTVTGPTDTAAYGRPLVSLLWWTQYQLGDGNPAVFHGVSLLLHMANCMLVLMLLKKLLPDNLQGFAGLIGFLWAVHPLPSEAVLYASQQTELLVSLMILSTLNAALGGHKITAIICCILGMFCKELMVVTPLLVYLGMSLGMGKPYLQTLKKHKRFHASLWVSCLIVVALMMLYPRTQSTGNIDGWNNWNYLLTQTQSLNHYIVQTIKPTKLAIDLWFPRAQSIGDIWPYSIGILCILATFMMCVIARQRIGFWLACFFCILAPTSSFIPITTELAAERRMYLPMLGLLVFFVYILHHAMQKLNRPNVTRWLLLLGCIVMPCLTFQRAGLYQSQITLYEDTVAKFPENRRAVRNLGSWYYEHKQFDKALAMYNRVLEKWPNTPSVQMDRAIVWDKLGQSDQAIVIYEKYLNHHRNDPKFLTVLGSFYHHAQQWHKAITAYKQAIKLDTTNNYATKMQLANCYMRINQLDKALYWQKQAIENSSPIPIHKRGEMWNMLGMYHGMSNHYELAYEAFKKALSWPKQTDAKTTADIQANLNRAQKLLNLQNQSKNKKHNASQT